MSPGEIRAALAAAPGWAQAGDAIEKTFTHADFVRTMAFANAVAWIAEREDHHPEMRIGYRTCTLRWTTHDVGGLSALDFRCAAAVDALVKP